MKNKKEECPGCDSKDIIVMGLEKHCSNCRYVWIEEDESKQESL